MNSIKIDVKKYHLRWEMCSCRSEEEPVLGLCYREDEVPGSIKGGTSYMAEKLLRLKKDCSPYRLVKDCQTA